MKQNKIEEMRTAVLERKMALDKIRQNYNSERDAIKQQLLRPETGEIPSAKSFELAEVDPDRQTLIKKRQKIEAILKLPNYADKDFRKLSIPYIKALADDYTESAKKIKSELSETLDQRKLLDAKKDRLINEMRDLFLKWGKELFSIGVTDDSITGGSSYIREAYRVYPEDYDDFFKVYLDLCDKYE